MKKGKDTAKKKTVIKVTEKKEGVIEKKKVFIPYIYDDGKITIKVGDVKYLIWFRNIICIKIDEKIDNAFTIFFDNDEPLLMSGPLKDFMKRLKYPDFIQTHNSSIANMLHARRFVKLKNTGILYLNGDHALKVSRPHLKEVDNAFDFGSNMINEDFIILED